MIMKNFIVTYSAPPSKLIAFVNKKTIKKSLLFYLMTTFFMLSCFEFYAQTALNELGPLSPDGVFDTLGDRFGNIYKLDDIIIDNDIRKARGGSADRNDLLCTSSGYFNLYFETGALGPIGTAQSILDARRNVFCQVFTDLSAFIFSPLTANNGKVNIWIRNISSLSTNPNTLGAASDFYVFPPNNPNIGGIIDGQVWKTINSGIDAYTNVAPPLQSSVISNAPNGSFFHGLMGFNFINFQWNTSISAISTTTQYDLYSVILHEATHILGFASLVDFNGLSRYGTIRPYFTRYDRFLRTQAGTSLLTQASGTCGSLYNYRYNPSLPTSPTVMNIGGTTPCSTSVNNTVCSTAVRYQNSSFTQSVYSPTCYEPGSSLSHFEDQCQVPSGQTPQPPNSNDLYFVMSNANGQGQSYVKRFLKAIERTVLCDIGYRVNTTYGGTFASSSASYTGGVCQGLGIVGVNDGIDATTLTYQFTSNVGTATPAISPTTNDYNYVGIPQGNPSGLSFECMQVVFGAGNISSTSGTSFTFTPTQQGLHLLRYIPIEVSTGRRGNITYIYIWGNYNDCIPSVCNLVTNGGFENTLVGCTGTFSNAVNCWRNYSSSPDLYGRNNCSISNFTIPTPTTNNRICGITDSYNGNGNNQFVGLWASGLRGLL